MPQLRGTLGALVGPGATALFVKSIGNDGVLYVGAAMYLLAVVLQRFLMIEATASRARLIVVSNCVRGAGAGLRTDGGHASRWSGAGGACRGGPPSRRPSGERG